MTKAKARDKKIKAMGRQKISERSSSKVIRDFLKLLSFMGPDGIPIVIGATGYFHFRMMASHPVSVEIGDASRCDNRSFKEITESVSAGEASLLRFGKKETSLCNSIAYGIHLKR
jgi:hypothetical protein